MSRELIVMVSLGFVFFLMGGLARTYMNLRLNRHLWRGQRGQSTERRYGRLIKEGKAPAWPLILAVTLMPLGIALVFGAIIWHNKHASSHPNIIGPK